MAELSTYLLVFLAVAVFFLFFHLMLGKIVRPARPDAEKLTIYECGEPTIGSSWIQFDLRFYVVALLFVIFDVEVVFFFPWAVVFGKANALANRNLDDKQRTELMTEFGAVPASTGPAAARDPVRAAEQTIEAAGSLAWVAFWDILVFFGVLLVGFAYLWKRGDLDWVRSTAAEQTSISGPAPPSAPDVAPQELVGAGAGR
jgi:NADH-quinone oxidoreductase subunit A